MRCADIEAMTDEEFMALLAQNREEWEATRGQREAEEAAYQEWLADAPRREAEEAARLKEEQEVERALCEAEGRCHPRDKTETRYRLDHTRRRLFEGDESEDEGHGEAGAAAGDGCGREVEGEEEDEGEVANDDANATHIVTMEEVLSKMTAAQARRRYAPSWAFIAWEVDRTWFATCLKTFFDTLRWPAASRVPATVRSVCRDSGVHMQELYVQEAFAPKYVAVALSVDQEWFDWLIDEFFSTGSWPRFDELPEGIQTACAQSGVRPNDLV